MTTHESSDCVVAAAMRNEGPFIVEWVAWYRMLGFRIIVATNDCTDHSPALLDALQDAGWVKHIKHTPRPDLPPKISAHRVLHDSDTVRRADWVLVCDVDEFLVLHATDTIQGLLAALPSPFLGVAFSWKTFGIGGWQRYQPGLTHRQFKRCGLSNLLVNRPFKSLYRYPTVFRRMGAHTPHEFSGDWAAPENAWITADGRPLPRFAQADAHPIRFLAQDEISHETAQMNHYVLRSAEHFDMKRGTPSASAFKDRYTDDFFKRRNRNGMVDQSALRFTDQFDAIHAQAMALPDVQRLHHLCGADYVARLAAHQGKDHRSDPRWQFHMESAG
ncbi:Glycosyl transferase family 2 [Cognatiyoonia koreensis]|uniref:Glycosyl transferase family 2 n=2 Tax=Cognatiyoonia koreensis TaxID=364200 RepID=A0A1I0S0C8_9RHOB|nr:Glycosyl transferase family 2 [Cognatiyoonia koreensis]